MSEPVKLDGNKPLWQEASDYTDWIRAHDSEIYDAYAAGDENAELVVQIVVFFGGGDYMEPKALATLKIAVERFISQHYPEIAIIVGKEST